MATITTWFKQNLKKPVPVNSIGILSSADTYQIGVRCFQGKREEDLSGSIKGYCYRPNGTEVSVNGSISGNSALITIPSSAFDYPGRVAISIKNINSSVITTLCNAVAFV